MSTSLQYHGDGVIVSLCPISMRWMCHIQLAASRFPGVQRVAVEVLHQPLDDRRLAIGAPAVLCRVAICLRRESGDLLGQSWLPAFIDDALVRQLYLRVTPVTEDGLVG